MGSSVLFFHIYPPVLQVKEANLDFLGRGEHFISIYPFLSQNLSAIHETPTNTGYMKKKCSLLPNFIHFGSHFPISEGIYEKFVLHYPVLDG